MITKGIYDLKSVQQNAQNVTVFKNHVRQYIKIRPKNQRDEWTAGSTIEIPLLGQGLDYINFSGSSLVVSFNIVVAGNFAGPITFPFGSVGMIQRYQLRAGASDIEDIDNYGRFVWLQMMGHGSNDISEGDAMLNTNGSLVLPIASEAKQRMLKIPLMTLFHKAGYVPIYNIAEDLVLRLELANVLDYVKSGNANAEPNGATVDILVTDMYFLADGMSATSGGQLSDQPFRFHTQTHYGRVHLMDHADQNVIFLKRFIHDLKKTSMKKWIGMFALDPPDSWDGAQGRLARELLTSPCRINDFSFIFYLGGQPFPFKSEIDQPIDMYYQYLKYFNKQDAIGGSSEGVVQYTTNWGPVDADTGLQRFYPAATFDKLDQTGTIISGIDTERYNIELQMNGRHATEVVQRFFNWFTWDVIVTIVGGEIKIED